MVASTHVNVGGNWPKIGNDGVYANVSGTWQPVQFIYNKNNGIWENTYVRDTTGPASPSAVTATWEGSGIRVNWTNPPDSDYSYMRLLFWPAGQPSLLPEIIVSAPTATCHYSGYILNNTVYTVYLTPVDIHGNSGPYIAVQTMAWTGAARGRTDPNVPFRMLAVDSGTWRGETGGWRPDGYGQFVYQGASISGVNYGVFFYGTQAYDYLRGATIYGANIEMERKNSGGLGTSVPTEYMWSNDCTSRATDPSASSRYDYTVGPGMARNGDAPNYAYGNLSAGFMNAIGSTSLGSSLRSIIFSSTNNALNPGIGNVSNSYMIMAGAYEGPYTLKPGLLNITHSG